MKYACIQFLILLTAAVAARSQTLWVARDALVLKPAPGYYENIAMREPVEASVVLGTWHAPRAGDIVRYSDSASATWEKVQADSSGWFSHEALQGGYAYVAVPAQRREVVLLEGMGHSMLYVNGAPRAGNPYQSKDIWEAWEPRFNYSLLPVQLEQGTNHLLIQARSGRLKIKILPVRNRFLLNVNDFTLPDLVTKNPFDAWGAVVVINASAGEAADLFLRVVSPDGKENVDKLPSISPMSIRKVALKLTGTAPDVPGEYTVKLTLLCRTGGRLEDEDTGRVVLRVVGSSDTRKETFISGIDGSVQHYAVNPPADPRRSQPLALFFSLHGASVEARNQAASYEPKSWGVIVAPTNRRPYGFNWEDWGRMDALEVLDIVKKKFPIDESRIYLTGHSMGGHGTYHLGVTFPDHWAAIGASAGWISFWSYRVREKFQNPSPMRQMLIRATLPSDTYTLARNLKQLGVYILHGSKDDNVPPRESRSMAEYLGKFHKDFIYDEIDGAGHWWDNSQEPGTDCVDWAPMFDFFARHARTEAGRIRQVDFATASPGISAVCDWVSILAQLEQFKLSSVNLRLDPGLRKFTGTTANVSRLALDLSNLNPGATVKVELDSQLLGDIPWPPQGGNIWCEQIKGQWKAAQQPPPSDKGPHRYGSFKDIIRNRVMFVYGTKGTPEENTWAFNKARFDAERFWYQGNGSVDVLSDREFNPSLDPDRNVLLYGNAETNAAWKALFSESPVQVSRGKVSVGEKKFTGKNLSCLLIRPRPGSAVASVAAVAGTGIVGMRLTNRAPYLLPGIAFPDLLIQSADVLVKGEEGVRVAGFFGLDWSVERGEFVWQMKP